MKDQHPQHPAIALKVATKGDLSQKMRSHSCSLSHRCLSFSVARILLLLLVFLLPTLSLASASSSPSAAFIDVISRDFAALTRKVTAHHILLPKSDEVALALKQSIRNKISPSTPTTSINSNDNNNESSDAKTQEEPMYIVDAFSLAAKKYSRDEETAVNGGLLGTLVPQGYCRSQELDQACFTVPLGEICGPIESEYGYHLLLVVERTNCPKLDGQYTKISRGVDGVSKVFMDGGGRTEVTKVAYQQVGFWMGVTLAGGVVAELAAKTANVIDSVPWE